MAKKKNKKKCKCNCEEPINIGMEYVVIPASQGRPKFYTVQGTSYLGYREDSVIVGIAISGVFEDDITKYIKACTMDECIVLELGTSNDVISREMTESEALKADSIKAIFKSAERNAHKHLLCNTFDSLLGKM